MLGRAFADDMTPTRGQLIKEDQFFWTHYVVAVLLGLLCVYIALERWQWLASHRYPLDYDGFYYLQELSHRLANGTGYYHGFSPFFRGLADLARLFDLTPATTLNVWVWGSLLLLSVGFGLIGRSGRWWWLSPALALLVWLSDTLFYLHYGFLRQAGAFAMLVTGLALFRTHPPQRAGTGVLNRAGGLVLIVIAAVFHLFAGLVGLIFVLFDREMGNWRWRIGMALPLLAASVYFLIPKVGPLAAGLTIAARPAWEAARLAGQITPFETAEFWIYAAAGAGLAVVGVLNRRRSPLFWALVALFVLMVLPVWSQETGGFAYRLIRTAPSVLFLALAVGLGYAPAGEAGDRPFLPGLLGGVLAAVLVARLLLPVSLHPIGPSMAPETLERHGPLLKAWIPEGTFVQAPHGIQFRVTYFLGRPTARELPQGFKAEEQTYYIVGPEPPAGFACPDITTVAEASPGLQCLRLDPWWYVWRVAPSEAAGTGSRHR